MKFPHVPKLNIFLQIIITSDELAVILMKLFLNPYFKCNLSIRNIFFQSVMKAK
jgi:hypothetical protein